MRRTILILPLLAGCVSADTETKWDALTADVEAVAEPDPAAPVPPELEAEARLDLLMATARARSPALRAALRRAHAALESVGEAAAWEDVVLKFTIDDGMVRQPFALDRAGMLMIGLMQMIPALGEIDARTVAAVHEGRAALEEYFAAERDLARDVRRAYADHYRAARIHAVHSRHDAILSDFERTADARYRAGAVDQTDVLKAQIELQRLRREIVENDRDALLAAARLNQLMHRATDAPLGPPPAGEPSPVAEEVAALLREAMEKRPEMRGAFAAIESARAQADLAGVRASVPSFTPEAMYGFVSGGDDRYDAQVGLNLPWLNPGRSARERAAGRTLASSEDAQLALADWIAYEVRAAHAETEAARRIAAINGDEILDRARRAVEITQTGYEAGTVEFLDLLDAERSYRDAELEYYRAVARHLEAAAELERAVGR